VCFALFTCLTFVQKTTPKKVLKLAFFSYELFTDIRLTLEVVCIEGRQSQGRVGSAENAKNNSVKSEQKK